MAYLHIIIEPNPLLRMISKPVFFIDNKVMSLIDNMFFTLKKMDGIGLAANQVSVLKRIIIINFLNKKLVLINPKIVWRSCSKVNSQEGCLSVPEVYGTVSRFSKILVNYINIYGNILDIRADGVLSFCIQHEIDHINGILFFDRLSLLKKNLIKKKLLI